MIFVALVGYGYWGPNLARCIVANTESQLAAICERSPVRAAEARKAHPWVPVHQDFERILHDSAIDAVVLATPTSTHGELALRALERGKHVLVEKPFAGSTTEAVAMAEASQRLGVILMADHTYLYSPSLEAIQQVIATHKLGSLRYYHSTRSNCLTPACETSVLWDLAVHDFAILDVLISAAPSIIHATGFRPAEGLPASQAQVTLTYTDHAVASVLVSWKAPAKVRTIQMGFDGHTIVWDDLSTLARVRLFEGGVKAVPISMDRCELTQGVTTIPIPEHEPLSNAITDFLRCIASKTSPRSGAEIGIRTVRLLEAAEASLEHNAPIAPLASTKGSSWLT